MFVSHDLSSFLLYLYVSTLVQCKNCLARDKSFLAIPTMLWLNPKKWFVLRHAKKNTVTTMAADGGNAHLILGEEEHPRQHRSCQLGSLHAEWVIVPRPPICYIMGE